MGFQLMRRAPVVAGVVLSMIAPVAGGQAVVRGILYDDAKGTPVRGTVMLVDPATDAAVVHVTTDSLGQFTLQTGKGTFQLAAVRPGYKSVLSAPIALLNGERLTVRVPIAEQGDPEHRIGVIEHIRPDADAAKAAESARQESENGGFERRRALGAGLHYDRKTIEKSPFRSLGEFLQNVPGFRVLDPNSTNSMSMSRNSALTTGMSAGGAAACRMGWFVDGHRMDMPGRSDPITDGLGSLPLETIDALEVFRGLSEMPAEFAAPELRCGAIAVWTRKG